MVQNEGSFDLEQEHIFEKNLDAFDDYYENNNMVITICNYCRHDKMQIKEISGPSKSKFLFSPKALSITHN